MRVLVTGGGGFLGNALALALARRGDTAIAFDTNLETLRPFAASHVILAPGDITDMGNIAQVFKAHRPDAVIHCAAIVGVLASLGSPINIVRVNIEGSLHVLETMRLYGVKRIVHISSEETYGAFQAPIADENHPMNPVMPYGVTKVAVEHLGRSYRDLHGIEMINLRTSWVYGPLLPRNRVPKNLIDAALNGTALHIEQGGDSAIDHTYIDDFVAGTLAALDHPNHPYDAYNLSSGTAPTLFEVVDAVKQIVPGAKVSIGPGVYRHGDRIEIPRKGALDNSRARQVFGYVPRFDIRAGLAAYAAATGKVKQASKGGMHG
jgi:UDP-glucose 4-epimerase